MAKANMVGPVALSLLLAGMGSGCDGEDPHGRARLELQRQEVIEACMAGLAAVGQEVERLEQGLDRCDLETTQALARSIVLAVPDEIFCVPPGGLTSRMKEAWITQHRASLEAAVVLTWPRLRSELEASIRAGGVAPPQNLLEVADQLAEPISQLAAEVEARCECQDSVTRAGCKVRP